jgi:hypothetical protein
MKEQSKRPVYWYINLWINGTVPLAQLVSAQIGHHQLAL